MEGEGHGEVTKAITAESALILLHAKGKERILVNVKAIVRCASEIIRIKQVQIFLVQLLPGLNIFVKEKQFMRWHKDICPQKSYIFTELQPTTLKKGCKSQHHVYTVTRHSRLKMADESDDTLLLNTEEWLQHCGIHTEDVQFTEECLQTEPDSKLVSYQGIVTKVLDGALGVFELDNRVRLYVSTVPALHKYSFIKEGSCITLYNVHCLVAKEAPKIRLYCCMLSVIKPEKEMIAASSKTLVPQAQLQKLLYFYGVTIPQLNWLYTTRDSLFQHLTEVCEKRDVEKMFSVLLSSPRLSWQQETTENRNLLDEFLSPNHACCLSSESQMSSTFIPCLTTVSQLKHDVESNNVFITKPNEYWQFERKEYYNEQVLIGILGSDLKTGHPKLYDSNGYIRAVIADSHGNQHLGCHGNCCCDTSQEVDNFTCPSLHTCCMGKIVAIYRFSVAMETFMSDATTSCDTASTSREDKRHSILYIEFSMTDAVILGNTATIGKGSKNEHKTAMVNGESNTCALRSAHEQKAAMVNGESNTCAFRSAHEQKTAMVNGESNTCALRSAHEQKAALIDCEMNMSALRMAKTLKSFGHSECTSVNTDMSESASTEPNVAKDKAVVDSHSYDEDSVRNNGKKVARTKNEDRAVRLTDNGVQQTDNALKIAYNALQNHDNTVQKTDNALKITDNGVQKKDNAVQKKDNAVQVTVNAVKKTDNCVWKTDNCVLKTDNALKITDNDVRKTDNCVQKTDNAVHIDDNAIQKTNALHIADNSIHASCDTEQKSDNPVQKINNPVHKSVNGVHSTNSNVHAASKTVHKSDNAVQKMESKLHRHLNEENVSYFCRKANCIKQMEREKSVPVLSVKPISQKRKSVIVNESNSKHSTDSTAQMVVKKIKRDVSSNKRSVGEINTTTDYGSRTASNATTSKVLQDTLPCKQRHIFTGMKPSKAWGENGSLVKVNSIEALIFVSVSQDGVSLMFHVQGQIWKNDKFEPEQVIIFKNKAVDWYPFLRPNCLYQFSLDEEFSPLFKGALADNKLVRAVERSKTKKCVLVHAEVKIEEVFRGPSNSLEGNLGLMPISEILESERKFVSLRGLIVNRSHSDPEPMKGRSLRNIQQCSNTMDWSKFQISTPQNRCIRLQVRDIESAAEITVFLNLAGIVYPLGLIPGTTVAFLNLDRKVSRMGNVYCRFIASSSILVIGISHSSANINKLKPETDPGVERDIDKVLPKLKLIDLWRSKTEVKEFHRVCDILQVTKISLKCVCDLCGSTVVQSECPSAGCHMENGTKFVTRASYIVDDGSSVAIVTLTGSDIMKLLGLSHDQWLCLEEETRNHGEVFIQQTRPTYGSALEKFVYMLCDNSQVKKPWMMSFKTKQYNSFNRRSVIDLDTLSLDDDDSNMMPLWFDGDCIPKVLIDNDDLSDTEKSYNDYEEDFMINAK